MTKAPEMYHMLWLVKQLSVWTVFSTCIIEVLIFLSIQQSVYPLPRNVHSFIYILYFILFKYANIVFSYHIAAVFQIIQSIRMTWDLPLLAHTCTKLHIWSSMLDQDSKHEGQTEHFYCQSQNSSFGWIRHSFFFFRHLWGGGINFADVQLVFNMTVL